MKQLKTRCLLSGANRGTQLAIAALTSAVAAAAAHGQCNCSCDALVPANMQINQVMMNEGGAGPTHLVSAGGPRNIAREIRHGNLLPGGMTITHVCIALASPTGQPGEIAHIQFYQPDPDPINMNLPGAMMYDQQFQVNPGFNGHQIVQLTMPQVMPANYWVVVAYPTARPSIGHQGTAPRTSGNSAVYVSGPSLPPPHNYQPGWKYYDDMGGPGGTSGYFGNAAIIRPLNMGPSGAACPYDPACCGMICNIDPSCCINWHPLCDDLALQNCFPTGCAACPPAGIDENEPCATDVNGGCDSPNQTFTHIACDTTVCGTVWNDAGVIDTDWYVLDVVDLDGNGTSFITIEIESETSLDVLVQNDACPMDINWLPYTGDVTPVCIPRVFGGTVPSPGQYRISVRPLGATDPCGQPLRNYTMRVTVDDCPSAFAPVNDLCINAGTVPLLPNQAMSFDNFNAGTDGPAEPCGFTGVDDADVWFTFVAPCSGVATLRLTSADHPDYMLAAYSDCPAAGGVLIACASGSLGGSAEFDIPTIAGDTYIVRMGAANNVYGAATIEVDFDSFCVGDLNNDCEVNVGDMLLLLSAWGPCADPSNCPADLNGDGEVNVGDMLIMFNNWGPCP